MVLGRKCFSEGKKFASMPTSLLVDCNSYSPESSYLFINIDSNNPNKCLVEEKQFREVVWLELIQMLRIVNTEAPAALE